MVVKLVGTRISDYEKDGKPVRAVNYFGVKEFTQYEQENNQCEGMCTISEFSRIDFGVHAGDLVDFVYEPGFKGAATLVDVKVLAIADKPPFEDNKNSTADTGAGQKASPKPEDQKAK